MSLRVRLDAGETRVVTSGALGVPVESAFNRGPGVVLIEGRVVEPEGAWAPDGWHADVLVVTSLADEHAELEVR
jgi:hypothetical protein